jgi:hypothetical protein
MAQQLAVDGGVVASGQDGDLRDAGLVIQYKKSGIFQLG